MSETLTISLKEQSEQLLDPTCTYPQMVESIRKIHSLFESTIGLSGDDQDIHRAAAIETAYGKALGLSHAAACLLDGLRTQQFLRGFVAAIKKKQSEYPGEQIKVFYAGCGPYAPFVTLVAPLFKPSELSFTILDINGASLNFAQDLISKLGYADFIHEVHMDDATTNNVKDAHQYHILFSETLDALLARECYVPILCNLLPQFSQEVVLIPENVQIKLTMVRSDEQGNDFEADSQLVFDARETVESTKGTKTLPDAFPAVNVPIDTKSNISAIILDTLVHIHDEFDLRREESQLTHPYAFNIEKSVDFDTLSFVYRLKPQIELFIGTEKLNS